MGRISVHVEITVRLGSEVEGRCVTRFLSIALLEAVVDGPLVRLQYSWRISLHGFKRLLTQGF